MSNWGIEDDANLGGNTELPGPKALRDAYEAMKQQNQELQNGLASVQKQLKDQAVASTLSTLGIPAAAAEQYKGEADPDKVREWATTMQTIFGGGTGIPNTPNPIDNQQPQGLASDVAQQMQRMNEAGQQGTPLGTVESAQAGVNDAKTLQDLLNVHRNF